MRERHLKHIIPIICVFSILFSSLCVSAEPQATTEAAKVVLTEAEQAAKEKYPELRIFLKGNRYPYAYVENGEYKGIYPDYLEKISALSGIEFTYVPYESDEQLESYFTMGKADGLACTYGGQDGLYKTTNPYTIVEYSLVASEKNDIKEEYTHTVAVSNTDIMLRHYIEENYPHWVIIPCSDQKATLKLVNSGKADMTFATAFDLQVNMSLLPYKNIEVLSNFSLFVPVSLAISEVTCFYSNDLISLLNKYIVDCEPMRADQTIRRKYILNSIYTPGLVEYFMIHSEMIIVLLTVIVTAIVILLLRRKYRKKAMEKDLLTGIWNKSKFIKESKKRLAESNGEPYLLAMLDVERFKVINDRFGTEVGDQTLQKIAANIAGLFRGSGLYGRSTSDEFVILTQDSPAHRELIVKASEMDIVIHNTTNYKVPIKVGVCPLNYGDIKDTDLTRFIDRAKVANANIKGNQELSVNYFTKKMGERIERENELETIMRKSLKNKEFVVYYQPKYDLENDKIIGAEALVRWQHPTKGLISPGDFVPLFERNGFIVEVDFYVYECVIKMLKRRLEQNKHVVPVSMNVSRCHLSNPHFADQLEALINKYKVPKSVIEMEITESIFSDEDYAAVQMMNELKKHDFTLSMDDFGSGYSSLNLLRELPIDILKIDKGFIDSTEDSQRSRIIVEEIISMADKIDIQTICEGVETEQQRDFLKQAGCDIAQGFFYARPMPQSDFEKLLDEEN